MRLLAALSVWLLATTAQAQHPSDAQMIMAVSEITQADPEALAAANAMIEGAGRDAFAAEWFADYRAMAILFHALWETDRMAYLDWAEGSDEALAQFETVFITSGLDWPGDMAALVTAQVQDGWKERGDAIGLVYIPLQRLAEQQGHRIMSINTDSDAYSFFLAPLDIAERWENVRLHDNMFIEHPDWQFAAQLYAVGLEPKQDDHPVHRARLSPEVDK